MTEEKTTKTTTKKVAPKKEVKKTEVKAVPKKTEKSDLFAVIKTGGKQYIVEEGKWYEFEKLDLEEGKEIIFDVLLVSNGGTVKVGTPLVDGAKVTGKVLEQFRDEKVTVLKYKPKKRYKKTYGHRQSLTKVQITKIA